ncbi:MAG: hypothetical protein FJ087_20400 [Deltaproteobacteria bacterium]|nr:hypothetical protein [Deltaproteobacteria bacterium]
MSLVVAMQVRNDDVVIAADRRGTFGDPRGLVALDECVCKLIPFGGNAALGIVGMPSAVLEPIDAAIAQFAANPGQDRVAVLHQHLHDYYKRHFGIRPFVANAPVQDSRPQVNITYVDRRPSGKGIYSLPSEVNFTPLPIGRPYALAGVSQYALYLYQRLWRADLTATEAAHLASLLITETSKLDPKVGPEPDVLILKADGISRLEKKEVDGILKKNDKRIADLAASFKDGRAR